MSEQTDKCECFACDIPSLETVRIVKRNGEFSAADNTEVIGLLKDNATVESTDGKHLTLTVKDNAQIERPLQIVNLIDREDFSDNGCFTEINMGENSSLTLICCDDSLPKTRAAMNHTMNISLGSHSSVEFYKMENVNNSTSVSSKINFTLGGNALLKSFFITLNGGKLSNDIEVNFLKDRAEADLNGLYLMDREQSVDTVIKVNHKSNSCVSRQLFKGILDDEARASFLGHILVDYDAVNNNAHQTNNNILLTDKAKVNTKPVLEIYNDDVECSHGATTGQLDQEALYYLRSRGIGLKTARMLLLNAFCQSVLGKSSIEELREGLSVMIQKRLDGDLSFDNPFTINLKD